MTDEEKRAAEINDLIDAVPMRAPTEPTARKTCVCCGAFALASDKDPTHLTGCKYAPPPKPGALTHRVECLACGSVGYARDGMPPFVHHDGCGGDGTLVAHQDRCGWVIGGAVATAGLPCAEVAAQVRLGRLLCATHADLIDSVDDWHSRGHRPRSFAEQVEDVAKTLAWAALADIVKGPFRLQAQRQVARTPREQVPLPGVTPKP